MYVIISIVTFQHLYLQNLIVGHSHALICFLYMHISFAFFIGSISATVSCLVYSPQEERLDARVAIHVVK